MDLSKQQAPDADLKNSRSSKKQKTVQEVKETILNFSLGTINL